MASIFNFVDFFFMLSGFIICHVYLSRLKAGEVSVREFLQARFARIYPLHLLKVIWMIPIYAFREHIESNILLTQIVTHILNIHAWGFHNGIILNFPSWSISGEAAAYLLFPIIAIFLGRSGTRLLGLVALSLCAVVLHDVLVKLRIAGWTQIALLRAVPMFVIGVALYHMRHYFSDLPELTLSYLQVFAVATGILLFHFGASLVTVAPIFALLILATWTDKGVVSRMLSHRYLYWLGGVSYTIYMLHIPVQSTALIVWPQEVSPAFWGPVLLFAVCLVATLSLAAVVHRFFEVPARRMLKFAPKLKDDTQ